MIYVQLILSLQLYYTILNPFNLNEISHNRIYKSQSNKSEYATCWFLFLLLVIAEKTTNITVHIRLVLIHTFSAMLFLCLCVCVCFTHVVHIFHFCVVLYNIVVMLRSTCFVAGFQYMLNFY